VERTPVERTAVPVPWRKSSRRIPVYDDGERIHPVIRRRRVPVPVCITVKALVWGIVGKLHDGCPGVDMVYRRDIPLAETGLENRRRDPRVGDRVRYWHGEVHVGLPSVRKTLL